MNKEIRTAEIQLLLNDSKDVISAIDDYAQNKIRKQWKWFAGVMVLFMVVVIGTFSYRPEPKCEMPKQDITAMIAQWVMTGEERETKRMIKLINDAPANGGCLNKAQLIGAIKAVTLFDSIHQTEFK